VRANLLTAQLYTYILGEKLATGDSVIKMQDAGCTIDLSFYYPASCIMDHESVYRNKID
jgi:hypothetical protein